jgi:hypothetical protein
MEPQSFVLHLGDDLGKTDIYACGDEDWRDDDKKVVDDKIYDAIWIIS